MTEIDALRLAIRSMLSEQSRIELSGVPDLTAQAALTEAIEILTRLIIEMDQE